MDRPRHAAGKPAPRYSLTAESRCVRIGPSRRPGLAGCFYSEREQQGGMETAIIDETTRRYLGQWQRLVSTTNWDKGRILCAWRQSLQQSGAPAAEYSDEAWSRQVGTVTPQHVGRLRRTWERFGAVSNDYAGLYWSHFQAASDWPDAEMWLEGAVQSDWSVLQMRQQRATALGLVEADSADAGTPWDEDGEVPSPGTARETVVQDPARAETTRLKKMIRTRVIKTLPKPAMASGMTMIDQPTRGGSQRTIKPRRPSRAGRSPSCRRSPPT